MCRAVALGKGIGARGPPAAQRAAGLRVMPEVAHTWGQRRPAGRHRAHLMATQTLEWSAELQLSRDDPVMRIFVCGSPRRYTREAHR